MEDQTERIIASGFSLASCQATIYTPDEEISPVKLSKDFLPKFYDHFNADPITLPSMEGMPKEIPRIILQDKKNMWRCEFASARVNYFWRKSPDEVPVTLEEFFGHAQKMLLGYKDHQNARVGRLAAVLSRYTIHPSPGIFLATHFCKESWLEAPLNRPESFELHAHKKFNLDDKFIVNSWVRNKTGTLTQKESIDPIILVEQDINTPPEEIGNKDFSNEEISDFFKCAIAEIENILKLYYPE